MKNDFEPFYNLQTDAGVVHQMPEPLVSNSYRGNKGRLPFELSN